MSPPLVDNHFPQIPASTKLSAKRSLMAVAGHPLNAVRKVPLKTQRHVTYNIQLAIGTPLQPLEVIFDTGPSLTNSSGFMTTVQQDPTC